MKKTLIVVALVVIFSLAMAGVALAEGYLTPAAGYKSPHGGFSTTTTYCKWCHAVHQPTGTYLLTRSTDNDNVCNVCHRGAAALSEEPVYGQKDLGTPGLGEHDVGLLADGSGAATVIPDSTGISLGNVYWGNADVDLNCKSCHSPHGSKIITGALASAILRNDPAYNGGVATTQSEFCTDCHNKNTKAGAGGEPGVINVDHNGGTHIMTTASVMSVSNFGTTVKVVNDTSEECRKCHSGGTLTALGSTNHTTATYVWPHETPGIKLLVDTYTQTTTLDEVCIACHQWNSGNSGVGKDY